MFHYADHRWPRPNHPPGVGELIARFALPLYLGPLINERDKIHYHKRKRLNEEAFTRMFAQCRGYRSTPLPGRPLVLATRFSSQEPDKQAAWTKIAIDRLLVAPPMSKTRKLGLGFLVDDDPEHLDLQAWWEVAPPGKGFIYLELWTNEQ